MDGRDSARFWNRVNIESANPQRFEFRRAEIDYAWIPNADLYIAAVANEISMKLPPPTVTWNWRGRSSKSDESRAMSSTMSSRHATANSSPVSEAPMTGKNCICTICRGSADVPPGLIPVAQWVAPGGLSSIHFSRDSKSIALSHWHQPSPEIPEEHFAWLIGLPDLISKVRIPVHHAKEVEFSPNGKRLALATQTGLTLWDVESRRIVWEVPQADLSDLAFTPDGRLVVTGGDDRLAVVRNSIDGTVRFRLAGHRSRILRLAVSPDSRTLATGDDIGTVKLWNVAVGQELLELDHPGTTVRDMHFTSDGRHLILMNSRDEEHGNILVFGASDDDK